MLEEVDIRMTEARKETHDFKREVIVGAENPNTGKTMADKFVKCGNCSNPSLACHVCCRFHWCHTCTLAMAVTHVIMLLDLQCG
jgi:hypothetical protein